MKPESQFSNSITNIKLYLLHHHKMSDIPDGKFMVKLFSRKLIRPVSFDQDQLVINRNQVAGHTGFYSLIADPNRCLKPFNILCVRGRREHLFYQLIEYHKSKGNNIQEHLNSETNLKEDDSEILYYKYFPLLTHPSLAFRCDCIINQSTLKSLSNHAANFYHVKHMSNTAGDSLSSDSEQFLSSVYSEELSCPCYGRDPKEKSSCSKDYKKVDFLCLEDLTSHCRKPCIIDIKIGQITYDPMAIKEKVLEQSNKYRRLREFGFRILGMKLVDEIKDKAYGKTLETNDDVHNALDGFFTPLIENQYKYAVISQILFRLRSLLTWFEDENTGQLKFFSSSLLIAYDSFIEPSHSLQESQIELMKNVRVSMIDFAHVFHVHSSNDSTDIDTNYIFGLRKLVYFFDQLIENCQPSLS